MGLIISALGAGGSLFIVPTLLFIFRAPLPVATGTSLAVVFAASLVGALGHLRNHNVRLRIAVAFGLASMAAAPVGAMLHPLISDTASEALFAFILLVAGVRMLLSLPADDTTMPEHRLWVLAPMGAAVGLATGFLGVGGGFLIVPALVWGARLPIRQAIGTSLTIIAATTATGGATYAIKGLVSAPLLLSLGGGAIVGALLGAPLSAHLPDRPVRYGFAALTFGVAIFMFIRVVRVWGS